MDKSALDTLLLVLSVGSFFVFIVSWYWMWRRGSSLKPGMPLLICISVGMLVVLGEHLLVRGFTFGNGIFHLISWLLAGLAADGIARRPQSDTQNP